MKEMILDILKQAGIISGIVALFFYLLKKWLAKYIDSKFSETTEIKKALLEIEKERLKKIEEKKDFIYPEILELVYRLKNQLQESVESSEKQIKENDSNFCCYGLGQELYFLTENLYKYRAYIDKDSFDNLHRYKRLLQDATVLFNSISRPDYEEVKLLEEMQEVNKKRYLDSAPELRKILEEIIELYRIITDQIKEHLEIKIRK